MGGGGWWMVVVVVEEQARRQEETLDHCAKCVTETPRQGKTAPATFLTDHTFAETIQRQV